MEDVYSYVLAALLGLLFIMAVLSYVLRPPGWQKVYGLTSLVFMLVAVALSVMPRQ